MWYTIRNTSSPSARFSLEHGLKLLHFTRPNYHDELSMLLTISHRERELLSLGKLSRCSSRWSRINLNFLIIHPKSYTWSNANLNYNYAIVCWRSKWYFPTPVEKIPEFVRIQKSNPKLPTWKTKKISPTRKTEPSYFSLKLYPCSIRSSSRAVFTLRNVFL